MTRIRSLDLARGFTVLCIPAIHSMFLYSQPEVRKTIGGYFLQGIAEGPGAQLLLLLMGVNVSLSINVSIQSTAKKSVGLFVGAYGLNMAKFVLLFWLRVLPAAFLKDLQIPNDQEGWWKLLLIGDIFHCAAISLMVVYIVKQCTNYHFIALCLSVVIMLVAPYTWQLPPSLFNGQPPQVFFPVFPWLVYPLCGLTIGYYLKQNEKQTFGYLRAVGLILIGAAIVYRCLFRRVDAATFYRTEGPETLYHIGIVLMTLYIWHWLNAHLSDNRFFALLRYSSKRITVLYIIQWLIIMWLLPMVGYQQHHLLITVAWIGVITGLTYAISYSLTNK